MSRFTKDDFSRIIQQPGYRVEQQLGHAAFHPVVAPGLHHPVTQLDAGEEPLDSHGDEAQGCPRIEVRITRCGIKLLDKDNLYGGAKPICDALRYEKLIPEDDPESINLIVQQRKVKRADIGTLIEITPIQ
jgi:hypothetical protein